jgi:lipopolysaccharide/colanic/teichoic acid biosynthesis glycosyltransferase
VTRAVDVALASVGLVVAAPAIAIAAVAIRVTSPGPAIYRQRRVGKGGREFDLLKLRTMVQGSDPVGIGTPITEGDPRITKVGAFLRRFSLDELPNLVNVLRGEMAIVGPRPTIPAQVAGYTDHQRRRLDVKPGLTGWAQINGRTQLAWTDRIELDVWYVEHRSLGLDLRILARTAGLLLSGRGLYTGDKR